MPDYSKAALCIADAREAALYFDRVLILNPYFEFRVHLDEAYPHKLDGYSKAHRDFFREHEFGEAFRELMPEGLKATSPFKDIFPPLTGKFTLFSAAEKQARTWATGSGARPGNDRG